MKSNIKQIIDFLKSKGFTKIEPNHYGDDFYSIDIQENEIAYSNGDNDEGFFAKDLYTLAGWYYLTYSKISVINL